MTVYAPVFLLSTEIMPKLVGRNELTCFHNFIYSANNFEWVVHGGNDPYVNTGIHMTMEYFRIAGSDGQNRQGEINGKSAINLPGKIT